MKLIPWTVNEAADIEKILKMGVDGIISDYPERVLKK
jgi:glycerophosphoryl diester phosphodiesterase